MTAILPLVLAMFALLLMGRARKHPDPGTARTMRYIAMAFAIGAVVIAVLTVIDLANDHGEAPSTVSTPGD